MTTATTKTVVIVDPYSTGCVVAQEFQRRGNLLVCLWDKTIQKDDMKKLVPVGCGTMDYYNECTEGSTLDVTVGIIQEACKPHAIAAVVPGGEAGVDLANALADKMNLRANHKNENNNDDVALAASRRNKKVQQELLAQHGMRSLQQASGDSFQDVEAFLQDDTHFPVVVKPVVSGGPQGGKLCQNVDEAKHHFASLQKDAPTSVLCQEFLHDGKEYVVDQVSRDGVHKTVMIWVYDKRPANGSAFVYHGMVPVSSDSAEAKILIAYMDKVLDALGVTNGPSHGEVVLTKNSGPCLIEVNFRSHGHDGGWAPICRALTGGYSQIEAAVDSYENDNGAAFAAVPAVYPSPFSAWGQFVMLVSYSKGVVKSTPGYEVLQKLPSFLYLESNVQTGSTVEHTTDLTNGVGTLMVLHKDKEVVDRDVAFVRHMESFGGLFTLETPSTAMLSTKEQQEQQQKQQQEDYDRFGDGPVLVRHMSNDRPELRMMRKRMTTVDASKEAVIVVDPYSTGACLAKEVSQRGYATINLTTQICGNSQLVSHLPLSCANLKYFATVREKGTLVETVEELQRVAGNRRIVACICGAEPGVPFNDELSEHLGVRTNGTILKDRRNKVLQQNLVRAAGLRAIHEASGSKIEHVEEFLREQTYPVVVKPVESAASYGVKLCDSFETAKEHFENLMNDVTSDGVPCSAAVCQEFLRGREYVVDTVSRDGVHKVVMMWMYDKRPANGSAFVYHGMVPVPSDTPEAELLIPYILGVLDALKIKNGPMHGEVMMTPTGPCLVEMNCRSHGGDGSWSVLAEALTGGYSQVDAAIDAYLDKPKFDLLPNKPPSPFKAHGLNIMLVSHSRGTVKATPGFERMKKLQSFVYLQTGVVPGSKVEYTTDLITSVGDVILMHKDKAVVEADVAAIRNMEIKNEIFEYEAEGNMLVSKSELRLSSMMNSGTETQRVVSDRPDVY